MAVYAAHLTRTLHGTPSVFQVTAQEALGATVKPALRKVVEYLSAVYPQRLGWALDYFDELFLLLDAALQRHYLKHYAASFSESFYGLVRTPISASSEFHSGARLPVALERASLVTLVLLPYLRDRLVAVVERWRQQDEDGDLGKSRSDTLRRSAVRLHTALHCSLEAWRLVQLARYLRGAAASPGPALWALGLALQPAPPHDRAHSWGELARDLARGDFVSARESLPLCGALVLRAAEHGAFLVQLLRWWGGRGPAAAPPLPPPPPPTRTTEGDKYRNKCPLCLQSWRAPAALPVSGYIYCYGCISRALGAAPRCPASGAPARPDQLVRVYLPD